MRRESSQGCGTIRGDHVARFLVSLGCHSDVLPSGPDFLEGSAGGSGSDVLAADLRRTPRGFVHVGGVRRRKAALGVPVGDKPKSDR